MSGTGLGDCSEFWPVYVDNAHGYRISCEIICMKIEVKFSVSMALAAVLYTLQYHTL